MLFMIDCSEPGGVRFSKVVDASTATDAVEALGYALVRDGCLEDGDHYDTQVCVLFRTGGVWGDRHVGDYSMNRAGNVVTATKHKGTPV